MRDDLQEIGATTANTPIMSAHGQWQYFPMYVQATALSSHSLVLLGSSAPWVLDAVKKLQEIGKLSAGWDSYEGVPLDSHARRLTVNALGWLGGNDLPVPAVVLGSSGTVQLEWRVNGKELEIELGRGKIGLLQVYPGGDIKESEEGEETADLPQKLRKLTCWLLHG
jgi:hypothetical protein